MNKRHEKDIVGENRNEHAKSEKEKPPTKEATSSEKKKEKKRTRQETVPVPNEIFLIAVNQARKITETGGNCLGACNLVSKKQRKSTRHEKRSHQDSKISFKTVSTIFKTEEKLSNKNGLKNFRKKKGNESLFGV